MVSPKKLYDYRQTNSDLIRLLKLQPHPGGGHFAVTHVTIGSVASPSVGKTEANERIVQSTIYYLLSMKNDEPDNGKSGLERIAAHRSAIGKMHRNRSETMHLHHCGRAVYTLISTSKPPRIRQVVMGEDVAKGEVRQLVVGGDEWKVSEIPEGDRRWAAAGATATRAAHVGCLISEVVTPGFDWEDHEYITMSKLEDLFGDDKASIERFAKYVVESPKDRGPAREERLQELRRRRKSIIRRMGQGEPIPKDSHRYFTRRRKSSLAKMSAHQANSLLC